MSSEKRFTFVVSLIAALGALACVTINVYFPEEAVKDLSERIEDAVEREAEEAGGAAGDGGAAAPRQTSWLRGAAERAVGAALHALAPAPVYAQEGVAAPAISNPAIRQIIQSRGRRVKQLGGLKQRGVVGESNRALVTVRQLDALPLQQRAAVQKLVREENADRERMFKEIAAATGADLSQLPQIRATYAETLRRKARSGDWLQLPDGRWQQKK